MTDATYRLAAQLAAGGRLSARPLRVSGPTRALLARLQGLHQLNAGRGMVTLPPCVRRSVTDKVLPAANTDHPTGLAARHAALPRRGDGNRAVPVVAARLTGAEGKKTGPALLVAARYAPAAALNAKPALVGRAISGAQGGAKLEGTGRSGPRLAVSTKAFLATPYAAAKSVKSGIAARVRQQIAAVPPQSLTTPGAHRTIRQAQPTGEAGHVYLDKTLVGYHLAAAITAEQTRAAARPNGSGASFNSSMAALRPTGAGL